MVDLKELERRLDEALAQETSESLSNWLFNQRADNLSNILGKGYNQNTTPVVHFNGEPENIPDNQVNKSS